MYKTILASIALFASVLTGCTAIDNASYPVDAKKIRSILVPPAINESNEAVADNMLASTISFRLSERGYYVFPVNTISTIFQYEGLYEAEIIHQKPAAELCKMFGADAVLLTKILNWESVYGILSTKTYVKILYTLIDKDGKQLFSKTYEGLYEPSGTSNSLEDIINNIIISAIERASPSYFYAADKANMEMSYNFAPGYYLNKQQQKH